MISRHYGRVTNHVDRRFKAGISLRAALSGVLAAATAGCTILGVASHTAPAKGWPSPVTAATYDGHQWLRGRPAARYSYLGTGRQNIGFNLIDCPAAGTCFAAGLAVRHTDGRLVTGLVARFSHSNWSVTKRLPGDPEDPKTLSCADVSSCFIAGSSAMYVVDGISWKRDQQLPYGPGRVACGAPDFCIAVGVAAYQYRTFYRGAWSTPRAIPAVPPMNLLPKLLSCAGPTFCLGMTYGTYWTFDGKTFTPSRAQAFPLGSHWMDETAISCASPSFCMAVGGNSQGGMASVYNGHAWSTPVQVAQRLGFTQLTSVSCPTPSFCAATGTWSGPTREFALIFNSGRWSSPAPIANVEGDPSVSCPSDTYCLALTGEVSS